jgi:lipoprotein NlpI
MRYCNRTAGRRAGTDRRTFAELTLFSLSLFSFSFLCLLPAVRGQDEPPLETLNQQAAQAAQRREFPRAIELLDKVVARDATAAEPYYWRGRANFCAGKIDAAVADFDKYGELNPSAKSRQWERGIALYYAGKFAEGAKQFELYQTFHDQDVENSAWRYLCVARAEGLEKAKENMLPIESDRRVPMMAIYDLYRGTKKPEDVLVTAEAGQPLKTELNLRLFYAHLYIGLWHEAAGREAEAKKHILLAEEHKIGHYMWDVAHVHAERLREEKPK